MVHFPVRKLLNFQRVFIIVLMKQMMVKSLHHSGVHHINFFPKGASEVIC